MHQPLLKSEEFFCFTTRIIPMPKSHEKQVQRRFVFVCVCEEQVQRNSCVCVCVCVCVGGGGGYFAFTAARAGLVIGHTGHFPSRPTHLRGRQNVVVVASAHWFVSCIDSVHHPITLLYRQRNQVFCSTYPNFFLVGFFHVFRAALSRPGLLRGEWCGPRRQAGGGEERSWIGKVLDRDSQRTQTSILMCACALSVEYANTF